MKDNTEMPTISFGEGNTYDMLGILTELCVRLWFEDTDVILCCKINEVGMAQKDDYWFDAMHVLGWSVTAQAYVTPLTIEIDKIRKIEVL